MKMLDLSAENGQKALLRVLVTCQCHLKFRANDQLDTFSHLDSRVPIPSLS